MVNGLKMLTVYNLDYIATWLAKIPPNIRASKSG